MCVCSEGGSGRCVCMFGARSEQACRSFVPSLDWWRQNVMVASQSVRQAGSKQCIITCNNIRNEVFGFRLFLIFSKCAVATAFLTMPRGAMCVKLDQHWEQFVMAEKSAREK